MTPSGDTSFEITRRQRAVVVSVRGTLDLAGSTRMGALLSDIIEGQGNLLVGIDLGDVAQVDPASLGVLAVAASIAHRRGGELYVVGVSDGALPCAGEVGDQAHLVQFYDDDSRLADSVRDFLEPGLRIGHPAVVVATERHRRQFDAALSAAGVDVGKARADGRYLDVDAEEALHRFMVDDAPDPVLFDATVSGLLAAAGAGGGPARVYGEMVAVLWAEGNVGAALAVEDLWNRLGAAHRFALLCAYPAATFDAGAPAGSLRAVCERHSAP